MKLLNLDQLGFTVKVTEALNVNFLETGNGAGFTHKTIISPAGAKKQFEVTATLEIEQGLAFWNEWKDTYHTGAVFKVRYKESPYYGSEKYCFCTMRNFTTVSNNKVLQISMALQQEQYYDFN